MPLLAALQSIWSQCFATTRTNLTQSKTLPWVYHSVFWCFLHVIFSVDSQQAHRYFKDVSHQLHVNVFSYEWLSCNSISSVRQHFRIVGHHILGGCDLSHMSLVRSCVFILVVVLAACLCDNWHSLLPLWEASEVHWLRHEHRAATGRQRSLLLL